MNVLFLDQFSELWGAQRCLVDLLPALEERGWRAAAALPGDGPLVKLLRERGVAVHHIPCGPYQSGGKSIADVIRFRRDLRDQVSLLRSIHAGLIYVNGPRLLPAAALAFGGRAPVLFHAHSRVGGAIASWLAGRSIRKMDATVIACCQAVAPDIRQDRLKIIANGIQDLGFRERVEEPRRIGIVGRVSPEKGQVEFLDAARMLAPAFPDAQFVLCGAPISPALQKLAEGLPVNFLGWREDVAPVLAELDLLAIPSKTEGMPRVMLEAFSAGVPVVAYPVGGIPEVIADNHTGFLVPERTAEALAARIRGVLMLPQGPLRTVAANARREWEQRYTVETYRKNVTDLMERLLLDWQAEHGKESPQPRK